MESEVSLYHTFMEEELGRLDCLFPIFVGNQEHNLYNQPFENLNGKIRKYTKSKLLFSSDDVVKKTVYLSPMEIEKKWTQPIHNWGLIMN